MTQWFRVRNTDLALEPQPALRGHVWFLPTGGALRADPEHIAHRPIRIAVISDLSQNRCRGHAPSPVLEIVLWVLLFPFHARLHGEFYKIPTRTSFSYFGSCMGLRDECGRKFGLLAQRIFPCVGPWTCLRSLCCLNTLQCFSKHIFIIFSGKFRPSPRPV